MVDVDDNDDEADKHSERHTTSIKEVSAYFDRLAIDNDKLFAVDKIYKADQKRMIRKQQQRRRRRRNQSNRDPPGHRSSCFSVVHMVGMSIVL